MINYENETYKSFEETYFLGPTPIKVLIIVIIKGIPSKIRDIKYWFYLNQKAKLPNAATKQYTAKFRILTKTAAKTR